MTRTKGQPQVSTTAHTATNLTDVRCPRCNKNFVGSTCLCEFVKPVVTNKAGKPYEVVWVDTGFAHVYHPGELEYVIVRVEFDGIATCKGYSNDERCWQFYQKATCNHCDAVALSIELGERPTPVAPKPKPKLQLEDLYSWVDDIAS